MRQYRTFIGVDLGGGKGKSTAVARLERWPDGRGVTVVDYGTGKDAPWYDDRLVSYLLAHPDALVAVDAPLSMPACVRCVEPTCPTQEVCEVPILAWFRARHPNGHGHTDGNGHGSPNGNGHANGARNGKPRYTPYTQRATEVLLHEEHGILPRETLGQGMGPLSSRGLYLRRALAGAFTLDDNLIEVYPKATLTRLFSPRTAGRYKRSADSPAVRLDILNRLGDLTFAPGAWREDGLSNDHKFDAVICAYTAYLHAEGRCAAPTEEVVRDDGWIWVPRA
jgi:predicted nuclease with RNAse H fold